MAAMDLRDALYFVRAHPGKRKDQGAAYSPPPLPSVPYLQFLLACLKMPLSPSQMLLLPLLQKPNQKRIFYRARNLLQHMFDGYSCVLLLQRAAPAASSGWGLKASLARSSIEREISCSTCSTATPASSCCREPHQQRVVAGDSKASLASGSGFKSPCTLEHLQVCDPTQ